MDPEAECQPISLSSPWLFQPREPTMENCSWAMLGIPALFPPVHCLVISGLLFFFLPSSHTQAENRRYFLTCWGVHVYACLLVSLCTCLYRYLLPLFINLKMVCYCGMCLTCECGHVCTTECVEVRGQVCEVSSLLPSLYQFLKWNSAH